MYRVSWGFKKNQIAAAFLASADESLIEEYENGWQEAVNGGDYSVPIVRFWDEAELGIFTNDQNRLVELSHLSIDLDESEYHSVLFTFLKSIGMRVLTDESDLDQARLVAQSVLEQEEAILAQGVNACSCLLHPLARAQDMAGLGTLAHAHALLGDVDEARGLVEELIEMTDLLPAAKIRALQHLDVELAVENAFAELAKDPTWDGFDELAAYYVFNRQILAHPRMQEHYVNEGKWLEYLAARVPEYAQFVSDDI